MDVLLLVDQVILLQVGDVFDHFLQDIVGGFSGVVLKRGAFTAEELDFLLVVIEHF